MALHFGKCLFVFAVGFIANSIKDKRVVQDIKLHHVAYHLLNILHPRVAEFCYLVAVRTDEVVVLAASVGSFVLSLIAAKLVLGYQIALYEHIERVIDRCSAHLVLFVFHRNVEFFYVEVVVSGVDFL